MHIMAQNRFTMIDARSAALSNAVLATSSAHNFFSSPALMCQSEKLSIGLHYHEKYFIGRLSQKSVSVVIPLKGTTIGCGISSFGFRLFNENMAGIGVSKQFGSHFISGIKLKYYYYHIANAESIQDKVSFEVGIKYLTGKKTDIGLWLVDPKSTYVRTDDHVTQTPGVFLGFNYHGKDHLVGVQVGWREKLMLNMGFEYHIMDILFLRAGLFHEENTGYSFGLGISGKRFRVDGAFVNHPVLGHTPFLTCIIFTGKDR